MNQPPPLPLGQSNKTLFHQAGVASIVAPLLAIAIAFAMGAMSRGEPLSQTTTIIRGAISVILILTGLCLGVLALCGIPRHGRRGLLVRGMIGVGLNGVLVAAMIAVTVTGLGRRSRESREAWSEVRSAADDLRVGLRTNYSAETGLTNDVTEQMGQFRTRIENAAKNARGDDAVIMQATAAFAAKNQRQAEQFKAVTDELTAAAVANFSTLTNRSQLDGRRRLVERFLTSNKEFKELLMHQDAAMEAELRARHLSPTKVEQFVTGFRTSQIQLLPKVAGIRACDQRMGQALLEILDLAEANWGRWRYDEDAELTRFQDAGVADTYNAQVELIQEAAREQIRLQGEIIEIQRRAAAARAGSTR